MAKKGKGKATPKLRARWKHALQAGLSLVSYYSWTMISTVKRLRAPTFSWSRKPPVGDRCIDDEGNVIHQQTLTMKLINFFFRRKRKPTRCLLQWVQDHLTNMGIQVMNFDTDWSDGLALCALVEALCPGACPKYDLLNPSNKLNNCRLALKLAQKYLLISHNIITADEMTKEKEGKKLREYLKFIRLAASNQTGSCRSLSDTSQTDASSCSARGRGLEAGLVGKISKFNIIFPVESTPHITVQITGPRGAHHMEVITGVSHKYESMPYNENEEQKNQPDNTKTIQFEYHKVSANQIEVNYIPNIPGSYSIEIKWRCADISRSPFSVIVAETLEKLNAGSKLKICRRVVENNNYHRPILERIPSCTQINVQDTQIRRISDTRTIDQAAAVLKRTSTVHRSYSNSITGLELQKQVTVKRRRVLRTVMTKNGEEIIIHEGLSTTSNSSQDSDELKELEICEGKMKTMKDPAASQAELDDLAEKITDAAMKGALAGLKHEYRVEALESKRRRFLSKCGSLASDAFRQRVPIGEGRRVKSSHALVLPVFTKHNLTSPYSTSVEQPNCSEISSDENSTLDENVSETLGSQSNYNQSDINEKRRNSRAESEMACLKVIPTSTVISTTGSIGTNESKDVVGAPVNTHKPLGPTRSYPQTTPNSTQSREIKLTNESGDNKDAPVKRRLIGGAGNRLRQSLSLPAFVHNWQAIDYDSDDGDEGYPYASQTQETGYNDSSTGSATNGGQINSNNYFDLDTQSSGFHAVNNPENEHVTGSPVISPGSALAYNSSIQNEVPIQKETGLPFIPSQPYRELNINGHSAPSAFTYISPLGNNDKKKSYASKCDRSTQVSYDEIKSETGWVTSKMRLLQRRIPVYERDCGNNKAGQGECAQSITEPSNESNQDSISSVSTTDSGVSIQDKKIKKPKGAVSLPKPVINRPGIVRKKGAMKLRRGCKLSTSNSDIDPESANMLTKFLNVWQSKQGSRSQETIHTPRQKFKMASYRANTKSKRVKFAKKLLIYYRSSSRKSKSMRSSETLNETHSSQQDTNKAPSKSHPFVGETKFGEDSTGNSMDDIEGRKRFSVVDLLSSPTELKRENCFTNAFSQSMHLEFGDSTPSLSTDDESVKDDDTKRDLDSPGITADFLDTTRDLDNAGVKDDFLGNLDDPQDAYPIESFGISDEPRDNLLQELSQFRRLSLPIIKPPTIRSLNKSWHFKTIDDPKSSSFRQDFSQASLTSDFIDLHKSKTKSETSHDSEFVDNPEEFKTGHSEIWDTLDFFDMYKPLMENEAKVQLESPAPPAPSHNEHDIDQPCLDNQEPEAGTLDGCDTGPVEDCKPDSSKCYAFGAGLHFGQVNFKNNFQVRTKGAGNGCLGVSITGPRPHTVTETNVMYTGDDLYEIIFEVTEPGLYVICIKWSDNSITDSPYICKVTF